ncbi:hypothetical protein ACU5B6_08545 [Moritella viscosa]|uniref:hypothetical protein n=1 Tax=Moritella viscosa TaxID=80854 RepID=UPI00091ED4EA|nr:hypothetical protein [Moritella viscosa]SHO03189.1 Putative uncharacterized protein [Moritella viscosa]SHO03264.1 Putative uncharacterized protein [Moritella viscosa]SHO08679.1 Putative uncharacterized protein [Moritella viscosa]SHO17309.1 Putative uncharacterized protein [Moritella viscosa]
MSWITSLFSFISAPIADLSGSYRERKRIAAEMAASIATAEGNLKLAKLDAEAKRLANQEGNDADYDLQVLKNRRESIMDEIIITVFLGLFIAHFVPQLQPYMANGWRAMGYKGAPWYFEFVIVGIAVSTLGLMRLFRAFWGSKNAKGAG